MDIFIGKLPFDVGLQAVIDLLSPYGATNIRALDGKGCAFAHFDALPDAERAINELNGYQLGSGPGLNVKPADSKGASRTQNGGHRASHVSPQVPLAVKSEKANAPQPCPEVFIGRLPPGTTLQDLQEALGSYWPQDVRLLDGKHCGFARFDNWASAEQCISEMNGAQLGAGGQPEGLNVKFADAKGAPKGVQQYPKVFIGGLNPQVTEDEIGNMCSRFGQITECKVFARSAGSPPCGFVTFSSFAEAEACISTLNGAPNFWAIEGQALVARFADLPKGASQQHRTAEAPPLAHARPQKAPTMMGLNASPTMGHPAPTRLVAYQGKGGPDFGAPTKRGSDDTMPAGGGVGPKVFIGGLPQEANEEFVWGMMSPFGRVAEVKVLKKPGAQSCGFARFAQPGEAEQAVAALGHGRFTVRYADQGTKRSAGTAFGP